MYRSARCFLIPLLLLGWLASGYPTSAQTSCYLWSNQTPLQTAVNLNTCVEIQAGVWTISGPITMPSGHTLRGVNRDTAVLKADASVWPYSPYGSVVQSVSSVNVVLSTFTIDGSQASALGAAARGMTIQNMRIKNARCSGVTVAGAGMVIENNIIENNGSSCPVAPPGAGIYAEGTAVAYAPRIEGNTIQNNGGPALDVNGVWGGTFSGNTVTNNAHWAAVSLYGASNWTVAQNTIRHPATSQVQPYHPTCTGGPGGNHSAGIFLCQDTDTNNLVTVNNTIRNNQVSSWYGILSIGNDQSQPYWAPRNNTFDGNNVFGSNFGCADDFQPGQWFTDQNVWTNNNCGGSQNTPPAYF